MAPLLEKYFQICENEGKDKIVMMQVGGFYEAYTNENDIGSAKELSRLLNIHLTKKSSRMPLSESNPYMCGIPIHAIQKHLTRLNDEGYEVMIYDQERDDPKQRFLRGTYSENMRMEFEDEEGAVHRKMYALFFDCYPVRNGRVVRHRFLISWCYIEMNTGKVYLHESDYDEPDRFLDEFLLCHEPRELLLLFQNVSDEEFFVKKMGGQTKIYRDTHPWDFGQQSDFFKKAFSVSEEDDYLVSLGLHRHPLLTECLGRLIRLIYKHDPLLVQRLSTPEFVQSDSIMHYNQDAMTEFHIMSVCDKRRVSVEKKKQKSLFELLSSSMNILGKRHLEKILRCPIRDSQELVSRYDFIERLSKDPLELPDLIDLEWYLLRWKRKKISTRLLGQLLVVYEKIAHYLIPMVPDLFSGVGLSDAISEIAKEWEFEGMGTSDSSFLKNVKDGILISEKKQIEDEMEKMAARCKGGFIVKHEDGEYTVRIKPKDWKDMSQNHGWYKIRDTKTYVDLGHPDMDVFIRRHKKIAGQLSAMYEEAFHTKSLYFLETYGHVFEQTNEIVSKLSCFHPLAHFFQKNCYTRPVINKESPKSFIACKSFRHPIIEMIDPDKLFVPFSCCLGDAGSPNGMLIYGMNSSGKSTMLKSIGMCIWLAQCGLYVPAEEMTFFPFDAVYTKIGIQDNLFMGHSTFVAEMNELLYILGHSTKNSFIMCDELTSGTETKSATGIVVSALLHFLQNESSFLFTTHLHTVAQVAEIQHHPKLSIRHFRIETKEKTKKENLLVRDISLRYDRELRQGSGDDMYGIEIAKAVGLPSSFIQQAFLYRERVEVHVKPEEDRIRVSRYNKKHVMTECVMCESRQNLHTHHITPQSEFLGKKTIHDKDGLYNLVTLCQKCHEDIHHKK